MAYAHSIGVLFQVMAAGMMLGLFVPPLSAQSADPGDPPHLKRYEGSILFASKSERFTKYDLLLSNWTPPFNNNGQEYTKKQVLEGSLLRVAYVVPDSERGVLEVHGNYLSDLAASGWEVLFSAVGDKEVAGNFGYKTRVREAVEGTQLFEYPLNDGVGYIAAKRSDPEGESYVTVYTFRYTNNGLTGKYANVVKPNTTLVKVDVIKPQAMQQRMVFVDASKMKSEIGTKGSVALYGILFDFNKTDLKPESMPTLQEIAKLLKEEPSLKLLVVGHTDNVGTLDFNKDLSARRAAAVAAELTGRHGIEAGRLLGDGVAFLCPVASNDTDEGRTKNRRVELVKW